MIYIASDHSGFQLKENIKAYLEKLGYKHEDLGASIYSKEDDYPDFISLVAEKVAEDPEHNRGIVLGGSGQGEAMVANRKRGVRAAVYYGVGNLVSDNEIIRLSREHNNANVLSLGARFISEEEAKKAVKLWLETKFSGEPRHLRRIKKLDL